MILSAVDLAFGYGGAPIGRGLTLSVDQGEVLCLLGPNGCGKTTLFKTLLGLIPSQSGRLELDGRPVSAFSRPEFARRVGYVPQASVGYFPFEVMDVVLMGRASRIGAFSLPSAADHAVARAALDTLGIGHLGPRSFSAISGGERQMVLIARALAQEPVLIVMDEPTASLDFGNQARVLERIGSLAASGLTIVLSTHDPGHAFACADKVALMKAGKIVAMGPPETVLTPQALGDLYGVEVTVAWLEDAGRYTCVPSLKRLSRTV